MNRALGTFLSASMWFLVWSGTAMWPVEVLASRGLPETIVGQVTCSECWSEADRSVVPYGGDADLACAARCAADGVPPAVAIRDDGGDFELVLLDGPPPAPHRDWLELISSFVVATTQPGPDGRLTVTSLEKLEESPWPKTVGANPDDLRWRDLTGAEQSVAALRGRIVVVNFWATWCAPCVEEMPVLTGIQADYGPLGVQVVGIAADGPDRADDVLKFARQRGLTFPLWLGATTADMASFEVGPALPATVVIDQDGHVVHRVAGVVEDRDLRGVLDRLIRGEATAEVSDREEAPPERVARLREQAALVPS